MHRPGDHAHSDLLRLLEGADTPLIRGIVAFLSAQQTAIERIAESLAENTQSTAKIQQAIASHVEQEEKFQTRIETGFAASRIITGIVSAVVVTIGGALLSLAIYVWNGHMTEWSRDSVEQRQLADRITKIEQSLHARESNP